ncbi:MAG: type II toxin-antitoxin system VapC family toxin [Acidobacteriota bacterium]
MIYYLDASALVKRYVAERGSEMVTEALAEAEATATAIVSRAEVSAAFAKAVRVGSLTREEARSCESAFAAEWVDLIRIQLTEFMVERAARLAWEYGLRGYDAVHLATAVVWEESIGMPVRLATFDARLWRTARQVGLYPFPSDLPDLLQQSRNTGAS